MAISTRLILFVIEDCAGIVFRRILGKGGEEGVLNSLDQLKELCRMGQPVTVSVACAADRKVLQSLRDASEEISLSALLFGRKEEILSLLSSLEISSDLFSVVDCSDEKSACAAAVRAISEGKADVLMKGDVPTASIMREVLNKEYGLVKDTLLSHVALIESPYYHKLIALSDGAMNIAPTLAEKASILENSVHFMHALGVGKPKAAILAAIEKVNEKMEATLDAAELVKMAGKGRFPKSLVDGPFALDNAVSSEAAQKKGIVSPVAGDADILLVPDIECGNVLYKALNFMGGAHSAGLILGASAPVILTSRADSETTKLYSIFLAAAVAGSRR